MNPRIKGLFIALLLGSFSPAQAAFINDPAPEFSLSTLDGKNMTLSENKGKVVFINFWASWCPPCKEEFPKLAQLAEEYKGDGFVLLAINLDKSSKSTKKFMEKVGVSSNEMKILLDPDSDVVASYIARSMPSSFIIDQDGVIRYVHFGYGKDDPAKWRTELNDLLNKEGK